MIDETSQTDDVELGIDTEVLPATICPLVGDSGNKRVLSDWLTDHDSYRLADRDSPVAESGCDLCIVDRAGLRQHREELRNARDETSPVLLPVLLLVPEPGSEFVGQDAGEIADSVLVGTVDEIVSTPIRQVEFEWRMRALLRLRVQSLALRAKQERLRVFRRAAEAAGHAIYITDSEGAIEYVNPAFEELTGYSQEAVLGETPEVLSAGEMSPEHFETLWETVQAGEVWEGEIIDRRKSGERYVAYQMVAPIVDDGDVSALVAVRTDITEREEAVRQLERHRDVVQRLDDPIMIQNTDGEFELLNEALADYAGVPADDLYGEDEFLFMDEETAARIARKKKRVLETEKPVKYSVSPTFPRRDQSSPFSTARYPYYDADGDLTGTIAICRNVTDIEERTQQLDVIDTVLRHNLRNSLTAISLLAEQLRAETDGERAETAEQILRNAKSLHETGEKSRAITSILTSAPSKEPVDLTDVVRSVEESVRGEHQDAEVTVDTVDDATATATLKIGEAIGELARNAVTHSDRESPSIEMGVETSDDVVTVSVVDDGPGVSEMDRDVLERGAATDDLYHGSGLGLWLVYWIVRQSGGDISVSDSEPRGTRVSIELPRRTADGVE
jgi:PAS domain S-box-containing protein